MACEVVQLQPGRPEVIALKFAKGTEYEHRVMFKTVDDRILYVAKEDVPQMERLGIRKAEPFYITQVSGGKQPRYRFGSLSGAGAVETPPVPVQTASNYTSQQRTAAPEPPPAEHRVTTHSSKLMSCFLSAIDAVAEAQTYATRKGLGITFSSENVTSAALSCYINECRNQNGGAR